jgi:hypothetical protein
MISLLFCVPFFELFGKGESTNTVIQCYILSRHCVAIIGILYGLFWPRLSTQSVY